MVKVYYDGDADLGELRGKKVAIIGYGSQGHAQAQNLRDSGVEVIVAELEGTKNYELAVEHGFKPTTAKSASQQADIIQILAPDQKHCTVDRSGADVERHAVKRGRSVDHVASIDRGAAPEVIPLGMRQIETARGLRGFGHRADQKSRTVHILITDIESAHIIAKIHRQRPHWRVALVRCHPGHGVNVGQ